MRVERISPLGVLIMSFSEHLKPLGNLSVINETNLEISVIMQDRSPIEDYEMNERRQL